MILAGAADWDKRRFSAVNSLFHPQRGSFSKPGVGWRNDGLPWDDRMMQFYPNGVVSSIVTASDPEDR
ncbi:MAG: hypothetical protein CFE26_07930 [Verrucomicrobiales bacterium VVV1]|nr:MAG: hypothetical protein CFE26_07930 [Verrucomicrobiales bacterium VVV1]